MQQFLSVKEATELVGKSESTIKRLLREVVKDSDHPDRASIQPSAKELEQKRAANEPYAWRMDRQFLLRSFPVDPDSKVTQKGRGESANADVAMPVIVVLREQLQSKDRQLEVLEKQLDRKDEQISNLNERMHESNVLMKELQERLAIAPPAASTSMQDGDIVDSHQSHSGKGSGPTAETSTDKQTKRQSFWARPIRLFGRNN